MACSSDQIVSALRNLPGMCLERALSESESMYTGFTFCALSNHCDVVCVIYSPSDLRTSR